MKKPKMYLAFGICMAVFVICTLLCFFNVDVFKKGIFQQTTSFSAPAMAKFEKDGNLYVIDNGSFRLVCYDDIYTNPRLFSQFGSFW